MMEISVLGPMRVPGGESLGPTQRRLLALLAVRAGEVVPTERIADDLGVTTPSARTAIARLRKVIGPALATEPPGYVLAADSVDATRFERLAANAGNADPAEAIRTADLALGLWRGPAFLEFADEAWAMGRAAGLDERRWALAERRVEALIALGRHAEAVAAAEFVAGEQPYREHCRELLMTALVAEGRRTEALRAFQTYRRMLADEAGTEPSPALVALDARIAAGDDSSTSDSPSTVRPDPVPTPGPAGREPPSRARLPRSLSPWVGPVERIDELAAGLAVPGLVTFVGTGGVGKTRSAIEAATRAAGRFTDGVRFVELAGVEGDDAVAAMATALSVQPQPGLTMTEAIAEWATDRSLLLVLDNCEHVVAYAAEAVRELLDVASTVTVLATSREPLGVAGERLVPIEPLTTAVGVELFVTRAHAAGVRDIDDDQLALIAELCDHLDGVPLAIELAAGRTRTLALPDLLARLDDRFRLLGGTDRGRDRRHQTLRDVVEWSYRLLDESEKIVMERASVFVGGFDLDTSKAVLGDDPASERSVGGDDVFDSIVGLVDKSILVADRTGSGTRFGMFETVRLYARERLESRGEAAAVERRFLDGMVAWAEATAASWAGPDQSSVDQSFDREWDNLRAAFGIAIADGDRMAARRLVLAAMPTAFCRLRHEHARWVDQVFELERTDAVIAGIATRWAWARLDHARLVQVATSGIIAAPAGDPRGATCRAFMTLMLLVTGRVEEAGRWLPAVRADLLSDIDVYDRILSGIPLAVAATEGSPMWTDASAPSPAPSSAADQLAEDLAETVRSANRLGSPTLMAGCSFLEALVLASRAAPDFDAVWHKVSAALAYARSASDVVWESQALNAGTIIAVAVGSDDALRRCRDQIAHAYDSRFWVIVGQAAPLALITLETAGRQAAATTIVGALERHFAVTHPMAREICARYVAIAREHDDSATLIADGAAMDRAEMTRFILAELDALLAV